MKKRRDARKFPMRNRHHILPKNRGGGNEPENILLLKVNRHDAYHYLFGDRTIEEAIALLLRVHRAKGRCTGKLVRCLLEARHDHKRQTGDFSKADMPAKGNGVSRVHRKRRAHVSGRAG
jgi:hypothetical protein